MFQRTSFIKKCEIFIYRCVDVVYKVRLYAWVYETSVGNVVSNYTRQGLNPYIQIKMAIETYGPAIFLSIIILSFIIFILRKYKINTVVKNDKILSLILISSTIFPIILYFTTIQVTYRKIAPTMTIILIFL